MLFVTLLKDHLLKFIFVNGTSPFIGLLLETIPNSDTHFLCFHVTQAGRSGSGIGQFMARDIRGMLASYSYSMVLPLSHDPTLFLLALPNHCTYIVVEFCNPDSNTVCCACGTYIIPGEQLPSSDCVLNLTEAV